MVNPDEANAMQKSSTPTTVTQSLSDAGRSTGKMVSDVLLQIPWFMFVVSLEKGSFESIVAQFCWCGTQNMLVCLCNVFLMDVLH